MSPVSLNSPWGPSADMDRETFSFVMSNLAMSLGLMSRKGGTGGTQRVQAAWACLGSDIERPWLEMGGRVLSFLALMD